MNEIYSEKCILTELKYECAFRNCYFKIFTVAATKKSCDSNGPVYDFYI